MKRTYESMFKERYDSELYKLAMEGVDPEGYDDVPEWTPAMEQSARLQQLAELMKSL
jgi:hypothetical protein